MIILARHGQTEWNKARRLQGWKNSPLTELGLSQASSVAQEIARRVNGDECQLFASPLGRAFNTAQIINGALGRNEADIQAEPLLKELSFGIWEGQLFDDIQQKHPEQWQARIQNRWDYVIPEGESYAMASQRAQAFLSQLEAEEGMTIIVSHEVIGIMMRGVYLGLNEEDTLALSQNNNEIVILENGQQTIIAT